MSQVTMPAAISVAIPNWNGEAVLGECLASVRRAAVRAGLGAVEVVVGDDASTDGSLALLRREFPDVRVVALPAHAGFGAAANAAVGACAHDHVLLLNTDAVLDDEFLLHWGAHFADPALFAVASWILRADGRTVDSGRRVAVWERGLMRHWVVPDRGVAAPSLFASGAAAVFDRRKFLALGGFDPLYRPMYVEDFDLSYAAWKRGWRVVYEPRCTAHHRCGTSAVRAFSSWSRALHETKNHFLFVWKNITDPALVREHLCWLPVQLAGAPFTGRRMLAAAFALALRQLGEARRRRRAERRFAVVSDRAIFDLVRPTAADLAHSPYRGTAGTA